MIEKHSTGAATLLTSILAKAATNILAMMTVLGRVPALLRTKVAMRLSILHFDSAAANVKPPRRSMMTGVHMAANTYVVASLDPNRSCGGLSSRTMLSRTTRKGIRREVTNSGMAYQMVSRETQEKTGQSRGMSRLLTSVAHSRLTRTNMAKQFCCSGRSIIGLRSNVKNMATITSNV